LIAQALQAGVITEKEAAQLAECPNLVLDLDALRASVLDAPEPAGRKGVLYYGVQYRLGEKRAQEAQALVSQLVAACSQLLPVEALAGL
jgi:hypothetical protein